MNGAILRQELILGRVLSCRPVTKRLSRYDLGVVRECRYEEWKMLLSRVNELRALSTSSTTSVVRAESLGHQRRRGVHWLQPVGGPPRARSESRRSRQLFHRPSVEPRRCARKLFRWRRPIENDRRRYPR